MSNIKVAKFGGSSLADAIQIRKIKDIVMADPERKYVVISAPGRRFQADNKVTDLLYLLKANMDQNAPYEQILQVVKDRFIGIERELDVDADIDVEFAELEERLKNGASADYLASRGEYLNAKIISKYLGFDYVEAAGCVLFGDKGRFLVEETNDALTTELKKHECAVIPGFYGTKPNGEIRTFSRGGSDITGSLVARAAQASVYENWTDVSGFLMADPRIVDKPRSISTISYKELRELSYMGASVLHENAIYPVRLANIPINIRNTNEPDEPGTFITSEEGAKHENLITGIAGNREFTVIAIYKNMMNSETGFIRRILNVLEDNNIPIEHIPSGVDTVSIVIANKYIEGKLGDVIEDIERRVRPDSIEVFEEMSVIATVGYGMASQKGVAARLFTALSEAGVNIRMIDQGSSEMNIIVGVEDKDFENAIRAIYDAFVK